MMSRRNAAGLLFIAAAIGTAHLVSDAADSPTGRGALSGGASSHAVRVQDCVVRFADQIDVASTESGRVAEVKVSSNDAIDAGTRIARLDDRSLLIRRRAALLRLGAAKSEATDQIELRYAQAALAEAKAELEPTQSIQRDVRGIAPMTQIRRMRLAVERGELEVERAKKRQQQSQVELQLREADLSMLDDQIRNFDLESPITGVVLDVAKSVGEWIDRGDAIATVARIDRLHVYALVSASEIAPGRCGGLPVSVNWKDPADGRQRSLRGKVISVDSQMMPGGRFRLHAEIVNRPEDGNPTQWQLRPGAEVSMTVYRTAATAQRGLPSSSRSSR